MERGILLLSLILLSLILGLSFVSANSDICDNIGLRISGNYCSTDKIWTSQMSSGESCENNFECLSNVCVSGKCVDSGLLQKIMNWFKRLFGIQDSQNQKSQISVPECENEKLYRDMNLEYKKAYKQQCYIDYAAKNNNSSYCLTLKDSRTADSCYSSVAINSLNASLCENIIDKSIKEDNQASSYDNCYSKIAVAINDENLCENIKNNGSAVMCFTAISKNKKDASICEKIKERDNKENYYNDQCYTIGINVGYLDCSIGCEKLLNEGNKNICYGNCGEKKKNALYCEKISFVNSYPTVTENNDATINRKNNCYSRLAIATKDSSVCNKIVPSKYGSPTDKEDCITYIQQIGGN